MRRWIEDYIDLCIITFQPTFQYFTTESHTKRPSLQIEKEIYLLSQD